jgi:hypothetical protein
MDGLVKFITDPAWWNVIATFVAAAVAAWITYKLGKRQNELQQQQLRLQEQQTKQQDYQLYKTMFQVISDANIEISNFLFVLYVHISNAPKKDEVEILLQQTIDRIKKVDEAILQSATDLHLKFPKEKTLIQDYRYLIGGMFNICNNFNELYKSGVLVDTKLVNDSDDAMIRAFPNDNKLVSAILAHIKDVKAKQKEYSFLRGFVYHKEKLFRKDYLTKISERCKAE